MSTQTQNILGHELPSVYIDWTDAEFEAELERVHKLTMIERDWISQAELTPYDSDADMMRAAETDSVVRVSSGVGYVAIDKLLLWEPSHGDPSHEHYYSAPYLARDVFEVMQVVSQSWQSEMGNSRALSITSVGRSTPYHQGLSAIRRKLAISGDGNLSSHQVLRAFDIDACGIVEYDDDRNMHKINPRYPRFNSSLVEDGRMVLKSILNEISTGIEMNVVEELIGTKEHTYHIAVKP